MSASNDRPHVDAVTKKLDTLGCSVVFIDVDLIVESGATFYDISSAGYLEIGSTKINLNSISSIWLRRPYKYTDPDGKLSVHEKLHFNAELEQFMRGLLYCIREESDDLLIMNDPVCSIIASNKVLQLYEAKKLGFNVASTYITNSHENVTKKETTDDMIIKMLKSESVYVNDEENYLPTQSLLASTLTKLMPPAIIQSKIVPIYELRVTMVGKMCFSAKITTTSKYVDWRLEQSKSSIVEFKISDDLTDKCNRLRKKLKLDYCAIDLIVDRDEAVYFLEINPEGQWLWIEEATNLKISDAIAKKLA